jgi:menaquinone-9 beta-reductase
MAGTVFVDLEEIMRMWDAIVIGAGPAGAFAAYLLAKCGTKVLLVDKAKFPRRKVCGCCISAKAAAELASENLEKLFREERAIPLKSYSWHAGSQRFSVALEGGFSLSRRIFDNRLVSEAVHAGAEFYPETRADVQCIREECVELNLNCGNRLLNERGRLIIDAAGLGDGIAALKDPSLIENDSRIGAATVLDPDTSFPFGLITMISSAQGYCGLVRLEDGRLNVAAALDTKYLKCSGSIGSAISKICQSSGLDIPRGLEAAEWQGTPALTRRRKHVAGKNFFVIGDASSYVEPFTGEGIYWALAQARMLRQLLECHSLKWTESAAREWQALQDDFYRTKTRACRMLSRILRSEITAFWTIKTLRHMPFLSPWVIRSLHG